MEDITKEQFAAYVKVQMGGRTNMLDTKAVVELSGFAITSKEALGIISAYDALAEKYPEVLEPTEKPTLYLYKTEVSIGCDVEVYSKSYEEAREIVVESVYVATDNGLKNETGYVDQIDSFDIDITYIENLTSGEEEE